MTSSSPFTWAFLALTFCIAKVGSSQLCNTQGATTGAGNPGSNGVSSAPSISSNGRYIAFSSNASNLVSDDTNGLADIFRFDRVTGSVQRVNLNSTGAQANGSALPLSGPPAISAAGYFVAFASSASNLAPNDINSSSDIFVRLTNQGVTEIVSIGLSGNPANGHSVMPSISSDGRYVAFLSNASNLVDGDTNNVGDIFVYDRQLGTTERVSVSTSGGQMTHPLGSSDPRISSDGRYVLFSSQDSSLVAEDTNGFRDVFLRDRVLGTTERVSVGNARLQTNGPSDLSSISADGRFVAFASGADNLAPGDSNSGTDIFVRDRVAGITQIVSVGTTGNFGNYSSTSPRISADGRYVVFESPSTNLVPSDTADNTDIFVRDRQNARTELVSVNTQEIGGDGNSSFPALSPEGRFVAFVSLSTNLVPADNNGFADIFLRNRICHTLDCNQNGIDDYLDIANGTSTDCNSDNIPDECNSSDCNGNGIPDTCDLVTGTSVDCNNNQVPDECEMTDCNANGILDFCDVASGVSQDINLNGTPDECEAPQEIFVDASAASDVGADGSPANPFKSIKAGVNWGLSGDVVRIRPGIYTGNSNKGILLNGRKLVIQSTQGANQTILDLGNNGTAFLFVDGDNERVVLDGLTIRGARTAISVAYNASPRIRNCVLTQNNTPFSGGAILVAGAGANPTFESCTISNNGAGSLGGGAFVVLGNPRFLRCTFLNNVGSYGGGGIYAERSTSGPWIEGCRFIGNSGLAGGGVMVEGTNALLLDSVFQDNISYSTGGGVHCSSLPQSSPSDEVADGSRVINCTIVENTTTNLGGGVFFGGLTTGNLENTILWDNQSNNGDELAVSGWSLTGTYPASVVVRYNDIKNGQPGIHLSYGAALQWGAGNIAVNPLLGSGGYHLRAGSPCLDAGDPLRVLLAPTETDIDGAARIQGTRVEIGADEVLSPTTLPKTRGGYHPY